MGDRRTEVNHPASGITSFTYDALGNVLTKQTANLAKEGKFITYAYDYQRLTGINYPDHPENNVKYYYGGRNASQNRIGRLMLREDGTGAIEYFYGKMGEVTKTRRTMIVPNQAIATYVTQWTYDSHNRLLEMIYPDEEKITYSYNIGGQLEKVHGYKSYGYDYVSKIGYDKFEQRTYLKYCNGTETFYTYDPQRRRLQNLTVNSGGNTIMDNAYTYDAVSNVLSVVNGASVPQSGKAGGQMAHTYTYDALYRLVSATGTYTGADNKTASYTLAMGYDNMHRITSKRQILTQNNVQFNGTLNAGYDLTYTYGTDAGKRFQLANVKDVNYRTEETPSESENVNNNHAYEYDANGNLVYVNTSRTKKDGVADEKTAERKLKWDEENRLLTSDDNGFVTNYWYDADGERTVKTSGESDQVYVNSEFAGGRTITAKFSLYVSPYLVANQGGRYTKHIYIGSQRVVSKIGDFDSYGSDPRRIQYAGSETDGLSVDYKVKYAQQLQVIKDNYATFAVPYNGEDNNDYVDGKGFCCNDGSLEAAQVQALARAAKNNFQEGDTYEKMQFYYHPDHLGSSSYITNLDGEVVQHIEYVPFGEVFVEERNSIWNTPYLFNAKEFDEETGLYYYGARYYEPRIGLWISTDQKQEVYPNIATYCYSFNSPINYIDPTGMGPEDNPQKPSKKEKYAMGFVDYVKWASQNFNEATNGKREKPHVIKGKYVNANKGEVTDTDIGAAKKYNMFVTMNKVFNIDESDAVNFKNYESHIVSTLMTGFISGTGPENYIFPENGIISSLFIGSDVLNAAINDFNNGVVVHNKQYSFGLRALGKNLMDKGTPYNLTGLVGSANITIVPEKNNMLKITIFNITSLTSGAFGKEIAPNEMLYPKSYMRDSRRRVPYGNISQTFKLYIKNPK